MYHNCYNRDADPGSLPLFLAMRRVPGQRVLVFGPALVDGDRPWLQTCDQSAGRTGVWVALPEILRLLGLIDVPAVRAGGFAQRAGKNYR